jgi:catechol 2,3-dioxygenase-like lactoylglutathione lyase family enzyme
MSAVLTLDHVVFPVRDADKTLAFYGDLLGLPLIQTLTGPDWGGYPWLMMIFGLGEDRELVTVALRGAPEPSYQGLPPDCRHYALAAASAAEVGEWRDRLAGAGVDFWEEQHGEQSSIYFPDPDGVILEITWPRASVPQASSAGALERARAWIDASGA